MNLFGWANKGGSKVLAVFEKIPEAVVVVAKLLFTGEQVAPEVKSAVTSIISACEAGSVTILSAMAAKGANWPEDLAAWPLQRTSRRPSKKNGLSRSTCSKSSTLT